MGMVDAGDSPRNRISMRCVLCVCVSFFVPSCVRHQICRIFALARERDGRGGIGWLQNQDASCHSSLSTLLYSTTSGCFPKHGKGSGAFAVHKIVCWSLLGARDKMLTASLPRLLCIATKMQTQMQTIRKSKHCMMRPCREMYR
jgi:hypothetical protein